MNGQVRYGPDVELMDQNPQEDEDYAQQQREHRHAGHQVLWCRARQIDRYIDIQMYRQIDRQMERQIDIYIDSDCDRL